ncbi:hypothetical protein [Pelagibacterium sp.]|uniref:hypothetical protein n=1 Tax=Pelagibacterium sp. TaxID=1967288 RepID=UPI003A9588C5
MTPAQINAVLLLWDDITGRRVRREITRDEYVTLISALGFEPVDEDVPDLETNFFDGDFYAP